MADLGYSVLFVCLFCFNQFYLCWHLTNKVVYWIACLRPGHLTGGLVADLAGWLVVDGMAGERHGWLAVVDWLRIWTAGWWTGGGSGWLAGWMAGWLAGGGRHGWWWWTGYGSGWLAGGLVDWWTGNGSVPEWHGWNGIASQASPPPFGGRAILRVAESLTTIMIVCSS